MPAIWITRNEAGIVRAASVAEFTAPETIKEWREQGRFPELVEAEFVQINRPLPDTARVMWIKEPIELAKVIVAMRYRDLLDVAKELVEMNAEGERDITSDRGVADTLYDWAESQVEAEKA